ncbi:ATP-binding protein [Streptomyces sp. NPDC052299]|uniref:ATP-binding protein n=1 Tax=Streptomyces sp. NPDC052299 TaxID=3155054 RepID=UPI003420316A
MEVSIARSTPPGRATLTESDRRWPGRLRLIARSYLRLWALERLTDSVELLITELVTNALRYGRADSIGVRVLRTERAVRIEVADGTAVVPTVRRASASDECGRGLFLVEAVADDWGVGDGGAVVWCALSLTEEARA